ncbi:uncharacterized protein [Typha latifolia]|uniref:uncharacterized protein n=1 Tax=Typha latifolia TaxID=4733 RepID=UPI003C306DAA
MDNTTPSIVNSLNVSSYWSKVRPEVKYSTNILRLDSPGNSSLYNSDSKGTKRKWDDINEVESFENPFLALSLGHSQSYSDNSKVSSTTACTMFSAKETDEESSFDIDLEFPLHLDNGNTYNPRKSSVATHGVLKTGPDFNLKLSLSTRPSESSVINHDDPAGIVPDLHSTMMKSWESQVVCTATMSNRQHRITSTKTCQFQGCSKGARGASGLCIAHGGGRRCQKSGCHKGAEGRTIYCKAHGGGKRCQFLGCTKSAEGRTDYCIAHGGGRRCTHEGCTRAARGKSGLCIRHGGGKRCQRENCTRSAEGYSGLCISHGGGRRCQFPTCTKGAQGSTMFCKAHGGGKRCTFLGCTKGAEGSTPFCKGHGGGKRCSFQGGGVCPKSVHGGTPFCVAHGGGKRCATPGCTKSARGRTNFCVRHGGGKRCKVEECGKSAQGSTDFCKAHGGGKRCSWGQIGSNLGNGELPCDRIAGSKTGLCTVHSPLVQDRCIHGGGKLGPSTTEYRATVKLENMKEVAIKEYTNLNMDNDNLACWTAFGTKNIFHPPMQSGLVTLPEGRVHGGSLMALLFGNATLGINTKKQVDADNSKDGAADIIMHNWM